MKDKLGYVVAVVLAFVVLFFLVKNQGRNSYYNEELKREVTSSVPTEVTPMDNSNGPEMTIDKNKTYSATLKTEKGDIVIELTADKTPITVNNFVTLAKKGFYDNTVFHRTITGFMIQGGDPEGTGTGGPGYTIVETPNSDTIYSRGMIAMAKKSNEPPGTQGSQFFIMHKDTDLPKDYVIFGKVLSGMEAVDAIAENPVKEDGQSPITPVKVLSATIEEK